MWFTPHCFSSCAFFLSLAPGIRERYKQIMTRLSLMLALLSLLFTTSACSLQSIARDVTPSFRERTCLAADSESSPVNIIYVSNIGWHTGVILRSADLGEELRSLLPEAEQSKFLEFGWGDREFYLSRKYSFFGAFKAAFFSSASVLQVAGFNQAPAEFFPQSEVTRLEITHEGLLRLEAKIQKTLQLDETQRPRAIDQSLYGEGHFYEAKGDFSIRHTCNTWASDTLVEAGCPIHAGRMRASSVSSDLEKLPSLPRLQEFETSVGK